MVRSKTRRKQHGVVLVIVLVSLAVAMALIVGWASVAALEMRQARAAEDRLQASWLAESAVDRAAARLWADPDYQGETWQIDASEMDAAANSRPQAGGIAVITVQRAADNADARQVHVRADYPAIGARTSRVSKQITIDRSQRGGKS